MLKSKAWRISRLSERSDVDLQRWIVSNLPTLGNDTRILDYLNTGTFSSQFRNNSDTSSCDDYFHSQNHSVIEILRALSNHLNFRVLFSIVKIFQNLFYISSIGFHYFYRMHEKQSPFLPHKTTTALIQPRLFAILPAISNRSPSIFFFFFFRHFALQPRRFAGKEKKKTIRWDFKIEGSGRFLLFIIIITMLLFLNCVNMKNAVLQD